MLCKVILAGTAIVVASLSISCSEARRLASDTKEEINADNQNPFLSPAPANNDGVMINDQNAPEGVVSDPQGQQGAQPETTQTVQVGLVVAATQRCVVVSESLAITINERVADDVEADVPLPNVTGKTQFEPLFSDSLRLVSRTDEAANFEFTEQDVAGLISKTDNGSVTTFFAGYDAQAPDRFIMRKPVSGGCLYAFKSGSYCAAGLTKSGNLSFSRDGVSMTASACELQNPDNLPVIEVPAAEEANRI